MHSSFAGARVDHGHHKGKAVRAINEAVALAKAVDKAVSMVNKGDVSRNVFKLYLTMIHNLHLRK